VVGLATTIAFGVTLKREREAWTPVTMFLAFCGVHAILGYYTAEGATLYLVEPSGGIYRALDAAFLIVTIGIVFISLGYAFALPRSSGTPVYRLVQYLQACDATVVSKRARLFSLFALVALAVIFNRLGEIPLFSRRPGELRYVQFMRYDVPIWAWLQNRCFDILQVMGPYLFITWLNRKRRVDLVLSVISLAVAMLAVRRALIAVMVVTVAIVLLRGKRLRLVVVLIPVLLFVYMASQYVLLDYGKISDRDELLRLDGIALPEVRDLAHVISSLGSERLAGKTLLYALIPLPSFSTHFQRQYNIRAVTLTSIGVPLDAPHGGPRIFLAGEAYVNFGHLGVVLICFGYGFYCGVVARTFRLINKQCTSDVPRFVLVAAWVLTSFYVYLAGTGAAGLVRFGIIALLCLFVGARTAAAKQ
jgi:hypothetical protein